MDSCLPPRSPGWVSLFFPLFFPPWGSRSCWVGVSLSPLLAFASYYGAAGSFVVILVWVYYSALISFFGAELTHVYTLRCGSGLIPVEHAHSTDEPG